MHSELAWVLGSSGTQIQSQIILEPNCLSDYLSVSYDYPLRSHNFEKNIIPSQQGLHSQSTDERYSF